MPTQSKSAGGDGCATLPFEDTLPANRELAARVRELGGVLPGDRQVDWQENRNRVRDILRGLAAEGDEARRTAGLTARLQGAQFILGGDEHDILRIETEADRVFKLTRGNNFGCRSYFSPADPELVGHFHGESNADPFFYLNRWRLLNSISEFQTRVEGVVAPERPGWLPRFCLSQPVLPGGNPTHRALREALGKYGFVEVSEAAFFDRERHILLTDASPRNVRVIDGHPVPFDVIAQVISGRLLDWCMERVRS
jgi:hypothetical protein